MEFIVEDYSSFLKQRKNIFILKKIFPFTYLSLLYFYKKIRNRKITKRLSDYWIILMRLESLTQYLPKISKIKIKIKNKKMIKLKSFIYFKTVLYNRNLFSVLNFVLILQFYFFLSFFFKQNYTYKYLAEIIKFPYKIFYSNFFKNGVNFKFKLYIKWFDLSRSFLRINFHRWLFFSMKKRRRKVNWRLKYYFINFFLKSIINLFSSFFYVIFNNFYKILIFYFKKFKYNSKVFKIKKFN